MMKNRNIVKKWLDLSDGTIGRHCNHIKTLDEILIDSSFLSNMVSTHSYEHLFSKMLSSLEWHPNHNHLLIGSRGGDLSCVDLYSRSVRHCSRGRGRGQQITDIKFDRLDTNWFYTSSSSGKVIKQRLDGKEDIILKDCSDGEEFMSRFAVICSQNSTENVCPFSSRFSCLDVCSEHRLLTAGDSKGHIHLMPSCESTKTMANNNGLSLQIHNSNVLHIEFNKFNTNLLITASIDCTAKLWDIRMISHKSCKPILTIKQTNPLNSATFSLTNGSTLLLTNYLDEISVYRGPNWQMDGCIKHSHEQTQRFCLLKAKWHPITDLFLIGSHSSYPLRFGQNYEKPQTIDVIDVKSSRIVSSLSDGNPGVLSMATFNSTGDTIAAIRGQNLIIFESIAKDL